MHVTGNIASWLLLGQILCLLSPLNLLAESNLPASSEEKKQYTDHSNGTVTDNNSGLMWQTAESIPQTWQQAIIYAQSLELGGFNDWRLPAIQELATLIDTSRSSPAINTDFFPGCRPGAYWSATEHSQNQGFAWYVDFNNGLEQNGGFKRRRYFIKVVRGESPSLQAQIKIQSLELKKSSEITQENKETQASIPRQAPETKKETIRLEPYPIGIGDDGGIIRLDSEEFENNSGKQ